MAGARAILRIVDEALDLFSAAMRPLWAAGVGHGVLAAVRVCIRYAHQCLLAAELANPTLPGVQRWPRRWSQWTSI